MLTRFSNIHPAVTEQTNLIATVRPANVCRRNLILISSRPIVGCGPLRDRVALGKLPRIA